MFGALIASGSSVSVAQEWQSVEAIPSARSYHAAATLGNRWYVAGGEFADGQGEQFPAEVDEYDPTSGHWTVIGNLAQAREYVTAVADPAGGRVVFAGGFLPAGPQAYLPLPTCDIAAPGAVLPAPDLLHARHLHALALAAGTFIVSGGWGAANTILDDAEVWDGAAAKWTSAGAMPSGPRAGHTMTTLNDGKDVLVVGGCLPDRAITAVDVFDAAGSCWRVGPSTQVARCRHAAVRLSDGRVLVAGGDRYSPIGAETAAEIFDPATGRWTATAPMHEGRFDLAMTLLPDGRALVAGGSSDPANGEAGALSSAEVYDPATDAWTMLPPMHDRRRWPTLAVLSDGVYVAGGSNSQSTTPGTASSLATVERLSWSDLGISGSIDLDAGAPGAWPADASPSCPGNARDASTRDAGPHDAAADGSERDGSTAGKMPRDAGSPPGRPSAGTNGGCSCAVDPGTSGSVLTAVLALAFSVSRRQRSRRT